MKIPTLKLADGGHIPQLALGTWQLAGPGCAQAVKTALDLGYTHIDTADMYGNHAQVGAGIAGHAREGLFITTKVWHSNLSGADVLKTAERALADLGTEYIDLLLIHWPNRRIPLADTLRGFSKLLDENKIRHFGVSNHTPRHIRDIEEAGGPAICANQVEFHPTLYQKELLAFCAEKKIVVEGYSPLGRGEELKNPCVLEVARKHGKTASQVVLRWELDLGIVPLPKASSEAHLAENIDVFDFKLDAHDRRALEGMPQKRLIDPPFMSEFDYR